MFSDRWHYWLVIDSYFYPTFAWIHHDKILSPINLSPAWGRKKNTCFLPIIIFWACNFSWSFTWIFNCGFCACSGGSHQFISIVYTLMFSDRWQYWHCRHYWLVNRSYFYPTFAWIPHEFLTSWLIDLFISYSYFTDGAFSNAR